MVLGYLSALVAICGPWAFRLRLMGWAFGGQAIGLGPRFYNQLYLGPSGGEKARVRAGRL